MHHTNQWSLGAPIFTLQQKPHIMAAIGAIYSLNEQSASWPWHCFHWQQTVYPAPSPHIH